MEAVIPGEASARENKVLEEETEIVGSDYSALSNEGDGRRNRAVASGCRYPLGRQREGGLSRLDGNLGKESKRWIQGRDGVVRGPSMHLTLFEI